MIKFYVGLYLITARARPVFEEKYLNLTVLHIFNGDNSIYNINFVSTSGLLMFSGAIFRQIKSCL